MPFSDVSPEDPYYQAVHTLHKERILYDEGDGKFHPNAPMNRDFFISLVMGISCDHCSTPKPQDIIRFNTSPFVDVNLSHPHYYCIARAQDAHIAQGYITDLTGKTSCENGQSYTSNPFCPNNSITRIEAVAILLRQAELWNDTLNQTVHKTTSITDVSDYWYGYAKKAIDIGLLQLSENSTI